MEALEIRFAYPDGREALRGVSFAIDRGEKVGLLGLNGAGKSTLLLCLAGVLEPSGRILLDGAVVDKVRRKEARKRIGLVFQDPNDQLFMTTVFEDVAFGPQNLGLSQEAVSGRVEKSLAAVGASGFQERLTHHLSFGEKKRVALATVLAIEPDLLLLDEPTSNLDPKRRREFMGIISQANQGMLIATHDLDMVSETCSRVLILQQGELVLDAGVSALEDQELLQRLELL